MNKKFLFPVLLTGLVLSSCGGDDPTPTPPEPPTPEVISFPVDEVEFYLSSRGVQTGSYTIPGTICELTGVLSIDIDEEDEYPHIKVTLEAISNYQAIYNQLDELHYDLSGDIFVDPNEVIAFEIWNSVENYYTYINVYAYSDLIEVPPEEEEGENKELSFPLQDAGYIAKETNLDGKSYTFNDFTFAFAKNGSNTPISEKSNYVALYTSNTLTISSKYEMKKVEFTNQDSAKNGNLSVDGVELTKSSSLTTWTGEAKSITFTALSQYRFSNIKIYYFEHEEPVIEGVKTIKEVLDFAETITYTPTNGWYLTNNTVTIKVKAIDAIDSVTTSGLDPQARGKVLCVDETGYIIVSSGVSRSNPIDFYQRVKDYIKAGTTTYVVTGKIAFLNDVVEIKVDSYQYDSSLSIDYDLDEFISSKTVNSSESFMNHCKNIGTNKNGYGVGEIVRLNGLTYFNKYRKSGSYYFLDRSGKLVPIYSLLDKDRSSMILGNTYDIIGLESIYNGRPSLRILEVMSSELEPVSYDLANAVKKDDTAYFYNVNPSKEAYKEEFYNSVTTVYKMDVYVSRYTDNDYTFNVGYHYDGVYKEYTTGNSETDAANYNSLGMSNENLDYNQTFYDYALELAKSEEGIENYKVTIYFTLALLKTVNGKEMWKANVFEDLVPQLGE